jgi:hypothetical protein
MAAGDVLKADVDYAVDGFFGESVGYKSLSGRPASSVPWSDMNAVVERSAEPIGISGELGRSPILIVVSKTDLSSVAEQVDRVKFDGHVYKVTKIVSEDQGAWELYCTP